MLYSVGTDRDDDHGRHAEDDPWAANAWRTPAEVAAFRNDEPGVKNVPDADWPLWRPTAVHPGYPEPRIRITRNYSAEYNATIEKVPEAERAWPVYREARMRVIPETDELVELGWPTFPDEPHWKMAAEAVRQNEPVILLVHTAAALPFLGVGMSDQPDAVLERFYASQRGEEFTPTAAAENPVVSDILMHHIGYFRYFTRILSVDCRRAYMENDADRFLQNCRALAGMSRHALQFPMFFSARLSNAIIQQLVGITGEMLSTAPHLCSDAQLAQLKILLGEPDYLEGIKKGLVDEYDLFMDFVQRTFTDDGAGNGVMTPEGWILLERLAGGDGEPMKVPGSVKAAVTDRKQMVATYDDIISATIQMGERPMWEWEETPASVVKNAWNTPGTRERFCIVAMLVPQAGESIRNAQLGHQQHDATLVALALESYRRRHARYPDALESLVPDFIAELPPDRFDGLPIKYRVIDGKPLLYSVGMDRDDDNGRANLNDPFGQHNWLSPAEVAKRKAEAIKSAPFPDADVVLWPVPREIRSR
jgi:hypothetical protein